MHSGFRGMHGTPGRAAHLARMLMMVALLPRGLIGGLREDPDAVSYPESTHTSASVPQTACAQLYRLVSILTTSLDERSKRAPPLACPEFPPIDGSAPRRSASAPDRSALVSTMNIYH